MSTTRKSWKIKGSYEGRLVDSLAVASTDEIKALQTVVTDSTGSLATQFQGKVQYIGNLLAESNLTFLPEIEIDYPAKINLPKDLDYLELREVAQKWDIPRTNYIGLAGARPLHISKLLGQESGTFLTFVKTKKDFNVLFPYCYSLTINTNIDFQVQRKDILKYMKTCTGRYNFIDLDFCCRLYKREESILESLENCINERAIVGITHTMRGYPSRLDAYITRNNFVQKLKEKFDVLEGQHTYYYNSIQMFRDTFVLQRKAA